MPDAHCGDATRRRPTAPPSLDVLLKTPPMQAAIAEYGASSATAALRVALDEARAAWRVGEATDNDLSIDRALAWLRSRRVANARRVFNCTGTTLHSNLGRAPLAEAAIAAAVDAMRHPIALEYDLAAGERGDRDDLVAELLCEATGAEAVTVVNNNAAAVWLVLDALAGHGRPKKEVIVSRGELIEIGGAFRLPDIMRRAGCRLVEVGTTNRTRPADFTDAVGAHTALILKAHASNYRVEGFTDAVDARELAGVARAAGVPSVVDLGAGALVDLEDFGLPHEPTVRETLAVGVDLVTFSADKLLGGPQAGIVAGRADLIARLKKSPLKRCLRCDKATLAALEATLRLYREPERLAERLTTLRWLTRPRADIRAMAERLRPAFASTLAETASVTVEDSLSQIGSGAQPVDCLPSASLVVRPLQARGGRFLVALERALRALPVPILGRVSKGALWLDCRTVEQPDDLLASWASLAFVAPPAR